MFFLFSLIITAIAEEDELEDIEVDSGVEEPEIIEDDPEEGVFHWQNGHEWNSLSLNRSIRAISSTWNDRLLAMDQFGRIYRLEGDGSWAVVFQPNMQDDGVNVEDLLLSVEGALQEQWDTVDDVDEEFDEETEELVQLDSIENEWEVVIDDPLLQQKLLSSAYSLWTDERLPLVFSCSIGGCVRSDNNGDYWSEIEGLPPSRDFVTLDRKYLAATEQGIWISESKGYRWRPVLQFPKGLKVQKFAVNSDYVLAATEQGIWISEDGDYWKKLGGTEFENVEFETILFTDSNDIWASSSKGLVYSSDLGQSVTILDEMLSPQILLQDEWNSGLVAFDEGLAFESIDQGKSWQKISNQLPNFYIHDVDTWKGGFVVSNNSGVFYISSGESETEEISGVTLEKPPEIDLETLILVATEEINEQLNELQVNKRTQLLRWVPIFSVEGVYGGYRALSANYDSVSTTGSWTIPWTVSTNFCFGNCQSASTDVGFSDLSDSVMVVGNSIYRTDLGGVVPAASSISMELKQMKRQRTQKIINLYSTTERLEQQSQRLSKASLLDQSLHEIERLEVAAILDLYTNGKYSATLNTN